MFRRAPHAEVGHRRALQESQARAKSRAVMKIPQAAAARLTQQQKQEGDSSGAASGGAISGGAASDGAGLSSDTSPAAVASVEAVAPVTPSLPLPASAAKPPAAPNAAAAK